MKKTKFNVIIMLAIIFASFVSTQTMAQGQCPQHGKEGMMEGMGKGDKDMAFIKDLTPEQQKQISTLKLNLIKDRMALQNLIDEKKAHLKTISTGDNVDMAAVNKTVEELFALKGEMVKKHIAFQQEVRKLLTPEQRVIFDIHAGKGHGRGERMGEGCQMKGMGHGCEMKGEGDGCGMKCKENGGCKMEGNGHGMGMGNGDMKECKQNGGDKGCCKEKASGCCKGKEGEGNGMGHMNGCDGHGQGAGNNTEEKKK